MKKTILSFAVIAILSLSCSAFAAARCPSVAIIHSVGSTLSTAYQSPPNAWIFTSVGYTFNNQLWQTHFQQNIPGVANPYKAIQIAEKDLANLYMLTVPTVKVDGNVTICNYTPQSVAYTIYTVNTVV